MLRRFALFIVAFTSLTAFASHVPGGYVSYECVGPNQYQITLTLFEDCGSAFTNQNPQTVDISNDCGFTSPTALPLTNTVYQQDISYICPSAISECDGGTLPGIYMHQWSDVITLPGACDSWTIGYGSCCMNVSTNVNGTPGYYWDAVINSQSDVCNSSAYPTNPAVPNVCVGVPSIIDLGFTDPDNDSLSFSFIAAQSSAGVAVTYNGGFSGASPAPGLIVDPSTGVLTFTPSTFGNYVIAILVEEYENGVLVGSHVYHAQIDAVNCGATNAPTTSGISSATGVSSFTSNSLTGCGGSTACFDITFNDADAGDVLSIDHGANAIFQGVTINTSGTNPATATICIPPQNLPTGTYSFVVYAQDNGCPVPSSSGIQIDYNIQDGSLNLGADQYLCDGSAVTLNSSGANNISWSTVSGDPINVGVNFSCNNCPSPDAGPSTSTVYVGEYTDACGNTLYDTVSVTVTSGAFVSVPDSIDQCQESIIDPQNSVIQNYLWMTSAGDTISMDSSISTGLLDYGYSTVYVIGYTGTCSDTDTVVVANKLIGLELTVGDTLLCSGNTTVASVTSDIDSGISDDFNDCADMSIWSAVNNGNCGQQGCGTMSGSGDALYFDGANGPRSIITNPVNTQQCSSIDFCIYLGNDVSTPAPCENIEQNENVFLQYSDDGGASWNIMQIFDQANWDAGGPYEDSWQCFSVPITGAAVGTSIEFRFIQPNFSACQGCDNWSLDNFVINCASVPVGYDWTGVGITDTSGYVTSIDPVDAGMLYVTATDSVTGCSFTDSVMIQSGTGLPVLLIADDTTVCANTWEGIDAFPNQTACPQCIYTWSANVAGNGDDNKFYNFSTDDTIIVEITDPTTGCVGTDTAFIYTDDIQLTVTPLVDTVCYNGVGAFTASVDGQRPDSTYTYSWSDLSTGGSLVVNDDSLGYFHSLQQSGDVSVTIDGDPEYGCTAQETMSINLLYPDYATSGSINGQTLVVQNTGWTYTGTYGPNWTNPQWIVTGGSIANGQGTNTIDVSWGTGASGTVQLVVEDINGCGYDTLSLSVAILTTGIDEVDGGSITVFPNPATDQITIEGLENLDSDEPLQILDITGRQVLTIDPNADRVTVDVSSLEAGMYTVVTADRNSLTRFVVNR